MDHIERLVFISNEIKATQTIECLGRIRVKYRDEVRTFDRGSIIWLLDEVISHHRILENPGMSNKDIKKLQKRMEKDGIYTVRKEYERSGQQNRGNWKSVSNGEGYQLPNAETKRGSLGKISKEFRRKHG